MDTPLQLRGKKMDLTPALTEHVEERTAKLEKYFDRITKAVVTLQKNQRHTKGFFTCEANLFIPKTTLHAKETKEDLHEAIDAAFLILERELKSHAKKIQESRRRPETRKPSELKKLTKRYLKSAKNG